jgi:hypothetical protein
MQAEMSGSMWKMLGLGGGEPPKDPQQPKAGEQVPASSTSVEVPKVA